MRADSMTRRLVYWASVAAGLVFAIVPLPGWVDTARPDLAPETVYWRLHFVLGMVHNNRFAEFDRLHHLSGGITREGDVKGLLKRMLDFAEAGFLAAS